MKDIRDRLRKKENRGGFTLAELLIVVAIIAVLVAIAIPIFNSQLNRAKNATSAANIRSAYAEASVATITGDKKGNVSDIEKTDDGTLVTVQNVDLKGGSSDWSGQLDNTSFDVSHLNNKGNYTGTVSLVFKFFENGKVKITSIIS